jgi:hypothetical protein
MMNSRVVLVNDALPRATFFFELILGLIIIFKI